MTSQRAIIVGASHAGAQLAASLRQEGWTGEIVLIGNESATPYQRPPLSKAYLAGKCVLDDIAIRSTDFYSKQGIQLLNAQVEAIARSEGNVVLDTGEKLAYDKLALCTGARPRRLTVPGADLHGVYYLRTAADVERIRMATGPGRRVVIVGGGYIGLETAASLRALGVQVRAGHSSRGNWACARAGHCSRGFDVLRADTSRAGSRHQNERDGRRPVR